MCSGCRVVMSLNNDVKNPRSIPISELTFLILFPSHKLEFFFIHLERFPTIKLNFIRRDFRRIKFFLNTNKAFLTLN